MFNDAQLESAGNHIASEITHISIHVSGTVASPGAESTAGREEITWSVAANGDMTAGPIPFTGGEASGDVAVIGYHTAASGGEYRGGFVPTGDTAFNAAGEYTVDAILEDASATAT